MNRSDWSGIRSRLRQVMGEEGDDVADRLDVLDEHVAAGRLCVTGVETAVDLEGLDVESANRLVRLWLAMVDHPRVGTDEEAMVVASLLARHGSYPLQRLVKRPAVASWLAATRWRRDPMPRDEMEAELDAYLDAGRVVDDQMSRDRFLSLLRTFRHRQLLRIFLREIEGASVRRTTAEVADVAQVCLQVALEESARRRGDKALADQLCVLGMGKLGGCELNFSSDVDLVFVASDEVIEERQKLAHKVVRDVVDAIDEVTDEGRVFRVDLRLRPEGSRGRLLPSESGLVDYLLNWGRTWERGAWLKARPVAGSQTMGDRILERIEPFLYRRHLDFDALDELRRMKELIDEESKAAHFVRSTNESPSADSGETSRSTTPFKARLLQKFGGGTSSADPQPERRSGPAPDPDPESSNDTQTDESAGWDVKIGRGGIREIEFFVQALQLVHCGTRVNLRVRTTLSAMDRLLYSGLLSSAEHQQLADAYDLFRRLEHRIQMEADRQSHRLPDSDDEFDDLAGRMGMSCSELRQAVEKCKNEVRSMFERLFQDSPKRSERATVGRREAGTLERVVGLSAKRLLDESVLERLREAGFSRPRQVAGQLQVLRQKEHGPFSESPASADPQLAQYLIGAVRDAPNPEDALGQLVRFSTSVGDTPATWSMLGENPHAARLLIHLFGSSPPVGGLLAEEPDLFERLVYGGSAQVVRNGAELKRDLSKRLSAVSDRARRMGRIRRFHREEIVRIALHEVAGAVDIETTCGQLTELAQVVIEALFREIVDEYVAAHHDLEVTADPVETVGLCVVAMGKLGGGELGFASDLDVIFVYDSQPDAELDHQTATRLAKRLVRAMSSATALGDLYEVDLRLRPSGSQGTLVVGFDAWLDYHRQRAELWERLALVRARPMTGPKSLRERIEGGRNKLAFQRPIKDGSRGKVLGMRRKLMEMSQSEERQFDVKYDDGGLLDVEFLTQWLQLCHGSKTATESMRSTFDALRALDEAREGIGGIEFDALLRDYQYLRRLECRLDISGAERVVPETGPTRRALAHQMGHQGRAEDEQFQTELNTLRRRVRSAFGRVFDGL